MYASLIVPVIRRQEVAEPMRHLGASQYSLAPAARLCATSAVLSRELRITTGIIRKDDLTWTYQKKKA